MRTKIFFKIILCTIFFTINSYPPPIEVQEWQNKENMKRARKIRKKQQLKLSPLSSLYDNSLLAGFLSGNIIALHAHYRRKIFLYTAYFGTAFSFFYRFAAHHFLNEYHIPHNSKISVLRSLFLRKITSHCTDTCRHLKNTEPLKN